MFEESEILVIEQSDRCDSNVQCHSVAEFEEEDSRQFLLTLHKETVHWWINYWRISLSLFCLLSKHKLLEHHSVRISQFASNTWLLGTPQSVSPSLPSLPEASPCNIIVMIFIANRHTTQFWKGATRAASTAHAGISLWTQCPNFIWIYQENCLQPSKHKV